MNLPNSPADRRVLNPDARATGTDAYGTRVLLGREPQTGDRVFAEVDDELKQDTSRQKRFWTKLRSGGSE
jgi:hypothetical protein